MNCNAMDELLELMPVPLEHAVLVNILRRARQELMVRDGLDFVFGRLIVPLLLSNRTSGSETKLAPDEPAHLALPATFDVPRQ